MARIGLLKIKPLGEQIKNVKQCLRLTKCTRKIKFFMTISSRSLMCNNTLVLTFHIFLLNGFNCIDDYTDTDVALLGCDSEVQS